MNARDRSRTLVALAVAVAVVLTVLAVGWSSASSALDPTTQGRTLVRQYFTMLHKGDTAGLKNLLAPNFRAVRSNGDVQNKASYVAHPPTVNRFRLSQVAGSKYGDVLVVSYRVTVMERIGGHAEPVGPSPRLSVFHRYAGAWHLTAHANLGATK